MKYILLSSLICLALGYPWWIPLAVVVSCWLMYCVYVYVKVIDCSMPYASVRFLNIPENFTSQVISSHTQ